MSKDRKAILNGIVLIVIGLVLRLCTQDVEVPVVSLPIMGNVLMGLGGLEVVATLGFLAWQGSGSNRR